jgi:ABC-type transport system substrate-binding protein
MLNSQLSRRQLVKACLTVAAIPLLVACGGGAAPPQPAATPGTASSSSTSATPAISAAAQSTPKTGGTFNVGHDADVLLGGDTMKATLSESTAVTSSINGVGNLVKYQRDNIYSIAPGVSESWKSNPDKTQWTFKLRDNITWHDGTPFTVQDAKWWLDLAVFGARVRDKVRAPAVWAGNLGKVTSVDALDQNHLQVVLAAPSPQFLTLLGSPINQIGHPRHLMQPLIDQGNVDVSPQDVKYVSIGPFKMVNYDKGTRVQVQRNDHYWETDEAGHQLPYLDGIQWAILPDPSAMDYALFNGQLDMGSRAASHILTKDRKDQYVQNLGDKVAFTNMTFTSTALVMNTLNPGPFQDVRVRQAVSRWIDRDAFSPVAGGLTFVQPIMNAQNPYTSPDFTTWPGFNSATRQQDMADARSTGCTGHYRGPEDGAQPRLGADRVLPKLRDVQWGDAARPGSRAGGGLPQLGEPHANRRTELRVRGSQSAADVGSTACRDDDGRASTGVAGHREVPDRRPGVLRRTAGPLVGCALSHVRAGPVPAAREPVPQPRLRYGLVGQISLTG